jgi:hypothetical protein
MKNIFQKPINSAVGEAFIIDLQSQNKGEFFMNELVKIKEMSGKYGISARTLRYYEDMGLIESVRNDDYAYRRSMTGTPSSGLSKS